MKTLGVFTRDFSLYHDILKVLKQRGLSYVVLSSPRNVPGRVGVILTSHREVFDIRYHRVVAVDVYDSVDHAVDHAVQILIGKELYNRVFIGIDPGERPGVAVVGDDILLQKMQLLSPEDVLDVVKRFLVEYPAV